MTAKKTPAQVEATELERVTLNVTIKGKDVEVTALTTLDDAPVDAALAWEAEKYTTAFTYLLGDKQMAKLRGLGMTVRDLIEIIMPAYNEATGLGED